MAKTINILSVIDVETILANKIPAGTATNPTSLGSYGTSDIYVYMITSRGYIDSADKNRADSELVIDANAGDTIQWELTCPGSGLQHDAIIAGVNPGSEPNPPSISTPVPVVTYRNIYDTAGLPGYQIVKQTDYCSNVLATGTTQYSISFQIMDNLGNSLGYYFWDPFVKVMNTEDYLRERKAYLKKQEAVV
ncbi:hypothetical protein E6C50_08655 [Flavobacterium supellecticarium]|uniref:Inclusion body protein n=1 Tax=Flavobacterium supellecticarium TaxID=2565924 RepID=A0A4S4A0I1_9FLAO|nr:AidA/PixA family protein [Flavobacterium supellecticarium]THF51816.1 hypothetical protein E6C50_08655 [Flavobacterium supellecticarium]